MGQNPANKYTPEFRREAADYVIASGRPITECCREFGLNSKTVNDWVLKRRRELGETAPGPSVDQAAELRSARKRIHELEMENEFLKKAAAFFARTQG
ncbi:transposase [Collinsella tanakaei]|nr:transposase [Collinsella tanakaei]